LEEIENYQRLIEQGLSKLDKEINYSWDNQNRLTSVVYQRGSLPSFVPISENRLTFKLPEGRIGELGILSAAAHRQKDFEKAIQFYEKAREYENAAKLAEKIGNLEKALELYKQDQLLPAYPVAIPTSGAPCRSCRACIRGRRAGWPG